MSTVPQILKRNAYGIAAGIFMLAAMVPSLVLPKLASAEQIQDRSIELSSAAPSQTGVTYSITFDVASDYSMQGIIVDFCDGVTGSPIIGSSNCSLPGGDMVVGTTIDSMTVEGGSDIAADWSATTINGGHTLSLTNATGTAVTNGQTVNIAVSGFTNTSAVGTFYARILTYDTSSISTYTSNSPLSYNDHGGVALSINPLIGVSATVQETLMFCVRGVNPDTQCTGGVDAPNITLGEGDPAVLQTNQASTGSVYYQVSTNAALGVTVRMKGATLTSGSNTINPLGPAAIGLTGEGFGFRVFGATSPAGTEGTLSEEPPYNGAANNWAFDETNLSDTYGQAIASSTGPVYDVNKQIEFAARAAGSTPAGVYTTDLSMVAVGRY